VSARHNARADKLARLLRTSEHDYGVASSYLTFLSPHELDTMIAYVEQTPRTTTYGRVISREVAARIVGVSLSSGNDVRLAMKFDSPNVGEFAQVLEGCGLPGAMDDQSPEQTTRISAVLYVADKCFFEMSPLNGVNLGLYQSFMKLVYENPTAATHMIEIAVARDSLDAELISLVRNSPSPALGDGAL
jgi:hypothetical protein